jgi:Skp family chaperone for outer membrane proteins
MKTYRLIAVSLFLTALTAISAFAQTGAGATQTGFKIAVVNTQAFDDEKGGIAKYTGAMNALETEFKGVTTELQTLGARHDSLAKEIQTYRDQASDPKRTVPIDEKTVQAKVDEIQALEVTIKRKQEDANARATRRRDEVLGPIMLDIGNALQDYAKQKGYAIILDAVKMYQEGSLLALGPQTDVTKDFIVFYNARPSGTAGK